MRTVLANLLLRQGCARRPLTAKCIAAAALLILPSLTACSGVRTSGNPDFSLGAASTYAWSPTSPSEGSNDAELPWDEFASAIGDGLRARGLEAVSAAEADVLVLLDLAIQERLKNNDPYFNLVVAERYEEGLLTLELQRRGKPEDNWIGERRHRLRTTAETFGGGLSTDWNKLDGPRDWRVAELVEQTLSRLP